MIRIININFGGRQWRFAMVLVGALVSFLAQEASADEQSSGFELEVKGYGDLQFSYHDYGPDQTQAGGSPPDHRGVFDQTRFVVELEGKLRGGIKFAAEVEFEHGGTGSALELEYEEFGEYEQEVERGGEVVLEELYLEKEAGHGLSFRLGRFYVALGLLPNYHRPTDYLGSARPESETTVVPGVWDEMGLQARYEHPSFRVTLQLVNGLDSTGFSSQRWIASGHQRRFELIRANDLALVGRFDFVRFRGLTFGASVYGAPNTTGNRPKPDIEGVSAPLLLASAHLVVDVAPVRARAAVVWGRLWSADVISQSNRSLSNNLGVYRSPVADEAVSMWAEMGVNVARFASLPDDHRVEPFVRVEYYDTMLRTAETVFNNPRFKRILIGGGVAYTFANAIVAKLDWTHRRLGSSNFRAENTMRFSTGFVF